MNKAPLNYLISFAIGCVFWVITGLVLANYMSDTIPLATLYVEDFLLYYRIAITAIGVISLLTLYWWFYYGNKDSTASDLDQAKKVWYMSFIGMVILAVVALFVEVLLLLNEGPSLKDYLILFGAFSLHSYLFYWVCSYLMSPRSVKYLVPLRR